MAETGSTKAEVPHFSLPLRYVGGKPIVNEQDDWDDVYDCVQAIVRYPKGFREDLPEFGTSQLELRVPTSGDPGAAIFHDEIEEWEPRTQFHVDILSLANDMAGHVRIGVSDPNTLLG